MNLRRFVDRFFARNAAPEPASLEARDPALITLVSIIYSTQPKTFTGDAVYVTMASPTNNPLSVSKPTSTADDEDDSSSTSSTSSSTSKSSAKATSSSTSKTASSPPTTTPPTTASSSTSANAAVLATITPSATAAAASSGMSGGAKAGLAFGLIILIALLAGAILFFLKKRKQNHETHERLDDEKDFLALGRKPDSLPSHGSPFTASTPATTGRGAAHGGSTSEKSAPLAPAKDENRQRFSYEQDVPRLNLRAVSQFNPAFTGTAPPAGTSTTTAPSALSTIPAAAATAGAAGAVGAAAASKNSIASDPNNPFGNHAEKLSNSPPQHIPLPASPSASSFGRASPGPQAADFPLPESSPATPAKKASPTLTKAEVATGTAVGTAAIAAATAAAASNKLLVSATSSPGGAATENVHRVQLDFMPSMEDELEIRAGQLVRVLHEYDDGWALCMRMDRSRQGVVPRTCLSKHSVKPRPQSPSRPGPRGPPPGVRPGAPPFAQSPRPLSPSGRRSPGAAPYSQSPRPLTPTGGRNRSNSSALPQSALNANSTQSPNGGSRPSAQEGANTKRRSNSMGNVGAVPRKEVGSSSKIPTPAGQVLSRKPVPGQS